MWNVITQEDCIWCDKVKNLLWSNKIQFTCHNLTKPELKLFATILEFKTVPQVFKDGERIGGYEETKKYLEG